MTDTFRGILRKPQNTLEATNSAIAMVDAEGQVVGWTIAAQRLVGYSAREVVGLPGS
ncbi:PAS domain-containing protein [Streptomyces sp. NPDC002205]|uniref:PAS domain-containing protein n=1 Tax=unclassified Streptomyces TaxID=2593676 RepID=UPI003328B421